MQFVSVSTEHRNALLQVYTSLASQSEIQAPCSVQFIACSTQPITQLMFPDISDRLIRSRLLILVPVSYRLVPKKVISASRIKTFYAFGKPGTCFCVGPLPWFHEAVLQRKAHSQDNFMVPPLSCANLDSLIHELDFLTQALQNMDAVFGFMWRSVPCPFQP